MSKEKTYCVLVEFRARANFTGHAESKAEVERCIKEALENGRMGDIVIEPENKITDIKIIKTNRIYAGELKLINPVNTKKEN